ncbi:MAG: phosphate/phosphite/phosphonate ABC transporter substrate-binding protein [Candidatus Kapabacteria bacterium]|nr:phosphate/phosphite/phosphonate ABC transporter substrate-binding protein [Candidatus Kapabacteria bacterium]
MRYAPYYLAVLVLALAWLTVRPLLEDRSLGSKHQPIVVMLTPSVDAQRISKSGDSLMAYLHATTGLHFRSSVPTNFVAVVEAFGAGKADIAIMNTFSYLLANTKYNAHAALKVVRRDGEMSYRGQLLAHAGEDINSLEDLRGRRIAYVDPSSTSGYIYPKALLQQRGIVTGEEVFANKHDNVVTMIYQRQVDAGATYYSPADKKTGELLDARARVKAQFPDVFEKIKILELTEPIPNDPVVFRDMFPAEFERRIIDALLKYAATARGKASLMDIASVEGLAPSSDADYAEMRKLVTSYSVDVEKALRKK